MSLEQARRDGIEGKVVVIDSVKGAYNRREAKISFLNDQGEWADLGTSLLSEGLAEEWRN